MFKKTYKDKGEKFKTSQLYILRHTRFKLSQYDKKTSQQETKFVQYVVGVELTKRERDDYIEVKYGKIPAFMHKYRNTRFFRLPTHGNIIMPSILGDQKFCFPYGIYENIESPMSLALAIKAFSNPDAVLNLTQICEYESSLNNSDAKQSQSESKNNDSSAESNESEEESCGK